MSDQQVVSLTKMSIEELEEKLKKHEFFIGLIKDEIKKRQKEAAKSETSAEKKEKKEKKPKKTTEKKSGIDATKDDMKAILKEHNVDFKVSGKKEDFEELIRKHNLVRLAEAHKQKRTESSTTADKK